MFITGPDVVRAVTGESIDHETLGGSATHTQDSGVADFSCVNDANAINQ